MTATLALSVDSVRMWWCPDCEIYCRTHPLDHLDQAHPPRFDDGSKALPERLVFQGIA